MADANTSGQADRGGLAPGEARNGSFTHVIAAHSLDDLRTKIAAAEQPDAVAADTGGRP